MAVTFQLSLEGQVGFGAVEIWGEGAAGSAGDNKQQRKEADQRREHEDNEEARALGWERHSQD